MLTRWAKIGFLGTLLAVTGMFLLCLPPDAGAAATTYNITVTQSGNGTIKPTTVSGQVPVTEGSSKRFTITPVAHYHLQDVLVDGSSVNGSLTWDGKIAYYRFIHVTADHDITAVFSIDTPTLTVLKPGTGTGTVTATNIACGVDCSESYNYGSSVELTATPDTGSIFRGWIYAGVQVSTLSTYNIKMNGNRKIGAKFLKTYDVGISKAGTGTGTVIASGINCGDDCNQTYIAGKTVTFNATPAPDSKFTGWSGDYTGKSKTILLPINGVKNITATFEPKASGIKITEKVSVVDTSPGVGVNSLKIGLFGIPENPDSDYHKDQTTVYVNERSAEAFRTINEILCMIGQTRYDAMLNKGNYKVQVDKNLCSSSKDDPSSAGQDSQNQSSGSTMPKYEMWKVNSSRVDDYSPQILKAWIHEQKEVHSDEPGRAIFAKVIITDGVTETNPYGIFTLYWKMFPEIGGTVSPVLMSRGILKTETEAGTDKVLLKFAEVEDFDIPGGGHETRIQKATLDRATNGSSGGGTAYRYQEGPWMPSFEEETFDFAFNSTNFLRTDGVDTFCLDRTGFDETAWRYGLYNSDGSRLNRNSGFSIKKNQGGKDYYGWIGYYGVWFPRDVTLNSGDQVYKMEFGPGSGSGELYDVLIAGGKLKKHVRKEMILGAIKNVPMDYWDNGDQKNYRVKWDGSKFWKVEWLDQQNNYFWKKIEPPIEYSTDNLNFDMLNFWSQSLGGQVQIKLNCTMEPPCQQPPCQPPIFHCTASDDLPVIFYAESIVFPGDTIPASFACFNNCPDVDKINLGDPFPFNDHGQPQPIALAEYDSYAFASDAMVLKSGTTPVVATNSVYQFGIMSGPLFEATTDNLALLACNWDQSMLCGWQAWSQLPEFYTWETGSNDWNKFTALVKDGVPLRFDPPLQVSYVHTWDDLTTSTFNIEYSGFGNLQGIPGKCVDWDTGEEVNCGENTRWIPQFSIAEGSEVTDVSDGSTTYYVKPLEKEQRMKQLDASACSTLSTIPYDLPKISQWQDPNIGAEPKVDSPPAVIGGVLQ